MISFLIYLILKKTCDKQMIRIGGGQQGDPAAPQVTLEKDNLPSRLNIYLCFSFLDVISFLTMGLRRSPRHFISVFRRPRDQTRLMAKDDL